MSKSDLLPIEQRVNENFKNVFGTKSHPAIVIGVSGGADSMCLLHIMCRVEVDLHVVHVNYQKRGEQSEKDADLVEQIAGKLNVGCDIITVDPEEAGAENFQQWARDVRYGAFETKADATGADAIATAHHRDDQLETILQKMFRGSGLASWSGMQVWDGRLFRPLLDTSRQEIEAYCRENNVPFRTDKTNLESDYARNFLRNEWLPELQQHFPGWRKNILRLAEQAEIFSESMAYILANISDNKNRINRKAFLALDEGLQKSVLVEYIQRVDASVEVSRSALKELSKLGDLQTGKSIQLTPQIELMRDRTFFKLVIDSADAAHFLIIEKEQIEQQSFSLNGLEFGIEPYDDPDFKRSLYLDAEALKWPLRLRSWQNGDRFQPLGMEGHQTVADHLANRKISATEKDKSLVLESFEETICAVIFPPIENRRPPGTISERFKCGSSTRRCLTINRIS